MIRLPRPLIASGAALLAITLLWGGSADAGEAAAAPAFTRFERAFGGASAERIADLIGRDGRLRIRLLAPRLVTGAWTRSQARKGLTAYFGAKGVNSPRLQDVTAHRKDPGTVRLYDYTYRPHGRDVRTTRLTVTVKQESRKRWVLASVIETARPRASTRAPGPAAPPRR